MKNRKIWWLVGGAVLLVLFLLVRSCSKPERFDWKENYRAGKNQPYDLSIFHDLLGSLAGDGPEKADRLPRYTLSGELGRQGASYVFIGEYPYFEIEDVDSLFNFIGEGGHALLSAKSISLSGSYVTFCHTSAFSTYSVTGERIDLFLTDSTVANPGGDSLVFAPKGKKELYDWSAFDSTGFELASTCGVRPIGCFEVGGERHWNCLQVAYGKGQLILHATPLAFTNAQMIGEGGYRYASGLCAYLGTGKILWDAASHKPPPPPQSADAENDQQDLRGFEQSPLRYLLSQRELRWAWYLLLALAALFLLFRSKRRQRIVPVHLPLRNTSLSFVQTVGRLYFRQNYDRSLLIRIMKQFLYHLRTRYGLDVQEEDVAAVPKIALKSGVPEEQVREIFDLYGRYRLAVVDNERLVEFHRAVDRFYKNAV
jgi:hypothetical protein